MAIAPVNKFINIAVPVAPGEQKLYEVPTGASSLVLYAQVSNVAVGGTYPKITFIQRRVQRSTGLSRDIRVIKDVEIPPNDAVILIDGRLVLEKTPLVIDRLYITGIQTGIGTITDVIYDEPSGIATVTTGETPHGFEVGSQITMAGIAFTCSSNAGITTNIFPDPQKSYTVDTIVDTVGTSCTFSSVVGRSLGYKHVYNPAIHSFVRAKSNSITLDGGGTYTPSNATYNPRTGITTFTIVDHNMITSSGSYTPDDAEYDGRVGILTVTLAGHVFETGDLVKFDDDSLAFKCSMDSNQNIKTYPRAYIDPMSGKWKEVTKKDNNNFEVQVGTTPLNYFTVSDAEYDPVAGIATLTVGDEHTFRAGITSVRLVPKSLQFTCAQDNHVGVHTYPRPNGYGDATENDPAYNNSVAIAATTDTTISLDVGTASYTGIHTFVPATSMQPEDIDYDPTTGVMTVTITNHGLENGDGIKIADNSLTFSCTYGDYIGIASHKTYPRYSDPISGKWIQVSNVTTNTFDVQVLDSVPSTNTNAHSFVSATAGITKGVVIGGGNYTHQAVPLSFTASGMKRSTDKIQIANNSLIFTCTLDNNGTEHSYPRPSDPVSGISTSIIESTNNKISVRVGTTDAGGQVAPLQMEFVGSVLENSNA